MPATRQDVDVVLRDGATARIRRARPDDEPSLRALLESLSERSRTLRYFTAGNDLAVAAHEEVADEEGRYGLVAIAGEPERIVGHAFFVDVGAGAAEVAFEVQEAWHGRGLATILLSHLAQAAQARGIRTFVASVMPENHEMISVFRDAGLAVRHKVLPGELWFEVATELTPEARARFEDRDRLAAVAAVRHFLAPASVALVGATDRPGSVGAALLANLRRSFTGRLYAVRPGGPLDGVPTYRSVPEGVELAVIAVPAPAVAGVARECAAAGVRALLVVSSGFEDEAGASRRRALLEVCRRHGMRLIGPNCLGVISARLNATFARGDVPRGAVGLLTQSGGLGVVALELGTDHGVGLSGLVSIGDRADVSNNDVVRYWAQDPATKVIALYLESFGNPRAFAEVARRVGRDKPIVAVKSGRSAVGARAAASHTGALVGADDRRADALFRHAGVIRCATARQLLDVCGLLASQPLPAGSRVGIVTNGGGPGILCADACAAAGLAPLPPVDLGGDAGAERFRAGIAAVAADRAVDAVIVIYAPTLALSPDAAARALVEARRGARDVPTVAVWLARKRPAVLGDVAAAFTLPEEAADALGRVARYAAWRRRPRRPAAVNGSSDAAAGVLARALGRGDGWLAPGDAAALARAYGLPLLEARMAADEDGAARAASELGGAVALKGLAPGLTHKTDVGAVSLGLRGDGAVRAAARGMRTRLAAAGHDLSGYLVQPMAPPGVELLIGVTQDVSFGPVVACGAGGTAAEALEDVAVRLAPLDEGDALEMLRELRVWPLLGGFRGAPPVDAAAVADTLERVAALAATHPEIADLDCNPVIARADGACVIDLRVRVQPSARRPPMPSLDAG